MTVSTVNGCATAQFLATPNCSDATYFTFSS
jgi:hypothetical protein